MEVPVPEEEIGSVFHIAHFFLDLHRLGECDVCYNSHTVGLKNYRIPLSLALFPSSLQGGRACASEPWCFHPEAGQGLS